MIRPATATSAPRLLDGPARRRLARRPREPSAPAPEHESSGHDSAVRSFSWMALSGILRQASLFLVNWHLMAALSRECFGSVSLAFGTMVIFTGVSDFGLRQVGWREIARFPQRIEPITAAVLGARLLAGLLALGLYGTLTYFVAADARTAAIYGLFAVSLLFNLGTFDFPFLARQRVDVVGRLTIYGFVVYFFLCQWTVRGDTSAWLVPAHFSLICLLIVVSQVVCYRREFGRLWINLRLRTMLGYLRRGWGLMLNGTLVRLGLTYPILAIGMCMSSADVADYRAPEIFYLFGVSFGEYLAASIFGRTARLLEENPRALRDNLCRVVQAVLTFYIPLGLAGAYGLPLLLGRIVNMPHEAVSHTAVLLSLLLPLGTLARFFRGIMPGMGLDYPLLWSNVSSIAMGCLGGWLLMKPFGIVGMALALSLAELWCVCWLGRAIGRRVGGLRLGPTIRPAIWGTLLAILAHAALLRTPAWGPWSLLPALGLFAAVNGPVAQLHLAAAWRGWQQRRPSLGGPSLPASSRHAGTG